MEKICPACGKRYSEPPALSRRDNRTLICPECGTREALEDFADSFVSRKPKRRLSAYERTKAAVYATGNKWAIENFHATHD